ncbi:hypothetical protein VSDG_10173 [Cytospora chrysosperma]|uniref:Zn(2)-C6 fungal-type domain-containing protein n=1 Tax=Cytospora chrysosperma TaxID=252740 RepID=A0A423V7S3_CYTCH|nr:hypothetical protein VSDG_10173 [Valsa sordida]
MVYCGKPSMGCLTCRARRIKCDETRPVCNQCTKSRRHCSGYRSNFDILHRDETQATAARARKSEAKKAAKRAAEEGRTSTAFESTPPENSSRRNNDAWEVSLVSTVSPGSTTSSTPAFPSKNASYHEMVFPTASPAVPLHQRASHFFAWNFIMVPAQWGKHPGHLEYLLPLLKAESRADSPFQLAYSACALAAMSNRLKADTMDLMELSVMQHSRALVAINKALRDPSESNNDSTLATVLLLSLFEKITAAKEIGMLAWRTHIEGAMQLVRSRGKEMVRSKVSLLLFNAVRMQIIARTLSSGTSTGMGVNWWLPESVAEDSIGARCQRFSLETSDLRAEAARLMASLPRNDQGLDIMLEMLRKVQGLDHRIVCWLKGLPVEYQPTLLYWEDKVLGDGEAKHTAVYPGRVDVYHDLMIANAWNASRSTRIILMSLLIRVAAWLCSPADFRSTPEYATAVRTSKSSIADIISAVPYMLRMHKAMVSHLGTSVPGAFACGDDEQSKMLGGLMVAWPLSTVRTSDYTTDEQREWAVGRLNFIANELGVKYASSLAAAKIRFPSMLIRRDGRIPASDPLLDIQQTLAKVVPVR